MIISHYKKLYELPWQTAICNIAQQSLYKKAFIRKNMFFEEKHIYLLDIYSEFIFLEYKKVFFPKILDCNLSGHFILLQKRIINEKFFPYQYFNIYLTHQKTYFYKKTYFELFYLSLILPCCGEFYR